MGFYLCVVWVCVCIFVWKVLKVETNLNWSQCKVTTLKIEDDENRPSILVLRDWANSSLKCMKAKIKSRFLIESLRDSPAIRGEEIGSFPHTHSVGGGYYGIFYWLSKMSFKMSFLRLLFLIFQVVKWNLSFSVWVFDFFFF